MTTESQFFVWPNRRSRLRNGQDRLGRDRSRSHDGQSAGDLHRRNRQLDAKYFQRLAKEERIALWVVGLPVHLDGRESQKSQEARRFGQWLTEITSLPVEFFDERFSSAQAEELLMAAELTSKNASSGSISWPPRSCSAGISNRTPRASRNRG